MDRLIATNSVDFAHADTAPVSGTPQYATNGNPSTNTPATDFPAYQYNALQEEVIAVLVAAGITPSKANNAQLALAIESLIEARAANYVTDTGVANAYVVAMSPAVTAYTNGLVVRFRVGHTNGGASTLNAGGGAVPLLRDDGSALAANDLLANYVATAIYDSGATAFLMESLVASQISALIGAMSGSTVNGAVRLEYVSATSVVLKPRNGNVFTVNGNPVTVPAGGFPLASSTLAASTEYNVYSKPFTTNITGTADNGSGKVRLTVGSTSLLATGYPLTVAGVAGTTEANGINQSVTVIDATHVDLTAVNFVHAYTSGGTLSGTISVGSTTAHVTGADGTEVKSGDATQAWVGRVRTDGSTHFVKNASTNWVRSAFNDPGWALSDSATISILALDGEGISANAVGSTTGVASTTGGLQLKVDGSNVGYSSPIIQDSGNFDGLYGMTAVYAGALTEGVHTITCATSGTGTQALYGLTATSVGRPV